MILRTATVKEAIGHALWEADACMKEWAYCAALTMMRKALDLWSADYRDRMALTFNKNAGEKDDLYWRLKKIAEQNPLYQVSIHTIIDGLRLSANEAVHEPTVCFGGTTGTFDAGDLVMIENPPKVLHATVVTLIAMSMPGVPVKYASRRRL